MRAVSYASVAALSLAGIASAQTLQVKKPALPAPPQNIAGTTPATLPPAPRILPQARQVGNPTGPVPNSRSWNAPPPLPQAPGIRDCGSAHPKNC